jgi:hypothetical protein
MEPPTAVGLPAGVRLPPANGFPFELTAESITHSSIGNKINRVLQNVLSGIPTYKWGMQLIYKYTD